MKTVTTREFYHTPSLVKGMSIGPSVLVTSNGKPEFIVKKAGKRRIDIGSCLRAGGEELFDQPACTFPHEAPHLFERQGRTREFGE